MTLDQLRYFIAAAKFEHIHRASQSIPISPSVVSHAVKTLEDEFNCRLFNRDGKKIKLTSAGARLLELSSDLLKRTESISHELGQANPPLEGHYRIAASHFLASHLVTPVWTALQMKFPKLTVDLHSQPTWAVVDSILAGRADFGVGFSPTPHPHLETEVIHQGLSEVVVRKDHPIFKQTHSNHYKLLNEYPATMHLATEKIFSARHHPVLKAANLDRNINFSFDSDFAALENLRNSNNWSFMLDIVTQNFKKFLRSVPVPRKSEAIYTIQIIRHKTKKADSAMLEAFKLMKEKLAQMKSPG